LSSIIHMSVTRQAVLSGVSGGHKRQTDVSMVTRHQMVIT